MCRSPGNPPTRQSSRTYHRGSISARGDMQIKFLTVNLRMRRAIKRSTCTKPHLKVQGSLTKQSATYVDALASGIVEDFSEAILARKRRLRDDDLPVDGLENQLINEVMLSSEWTVKRDWKFAKEGHISTFWRSELSTASSLICWGWDLTIVLWPWWLLCHERSRIQREVFFQNHIGPFEG